MGMTTAEFNSFMTRETEEKKRRESGNAALSPSASQPDPQTSEPAPSTGRVSKAEFNSYMTQKARADNFNTYGADYDRWINDVNAFGKNTYDQSQEWKDSTTASALLAKSHGDAAALKRRGQGIFNFFTNYADDIDAENGAGTAKRVLDSITSAQKGIDDAQNYYNYVTQSWAAAPDAQTYGKYQEWTKNPRSSADVAKDIESANTRIAELKIKSSGYNKGIEAPETSAPGWAAEASPRAKLDAQRNATREAAISAHDDLGAEEQRLANLRQELKFRQDNETYEKQQKWKAGRRGVQAITVNLDTVNGNISDLEREEGRLAGVLNDLEGQKYDPAFDQAYYDRVKAQHDGITKQLDELRGVQKNLSDELSYNKYLDREDERAKWAEYANSADFAEKSAYSPTGFGKEDINYAPKLDYFTALVLSGFNPAAADLLYNGSQLLNPDDADRDREVTYGLANRDAAAFTQNFANKAPNEVLLGQIPTDGIEYYQMSPDERATYNYLYATDKTKADEYMEWLYPQLTERQRDLETKAVHDWTQENAAHAIVGNVASVLASPLKALSYGSQVADLINTGKIDENAGYNRYSYLNNAVREATSENWGEVGTFAYQTGMSMADFLWNAFITGGLSGGGAVAENLSLAIMGASSAADTVIEQKDRGMDDARAFTLGTVAGLAEIVTEKVSLEALLKPDLSKGAFSYLIKNVLAEGSEEGASDLINYFADDLYDLISGQEASKWHEAINNYRAQGYTESEAFGRALADRAGEVGLDMLGGALSGGVMAGGSIALNAYQNGKLVKEGLKAPEGSEIRKTAEQIRAEVNAGQKVSQAEYEKLGQLINANTQFRDILNTELNEQKNSASEAETGSTVINTNPAQHTPAEQKVIDEYQAAVDENLVNFVETSMENKGSNKGKYTLKPVSERASADIKNLTGIDTTGYKTVLEQRMAEHIVDRHGADGAANKFMQDFNDIGRMQYILDNYDRMELAGNTRAYTTNKYNGMPGQAKTVKYIKAVNGTYYVIEAVPDTKAKTAFIVSAYMSGNTKTGNLQTADANAPAYTAKTENAAIPATQTIPQTSANSQEGNAADESLTGSPFLDDVLRNILEKGSKVTNDQARTIAGDGTMLDALAEITGLDLSHIGEQSDGKQRRQAKSAVYQAVGEIRRNSGTAFGTDALSKLGIKVEGNVARYGQTAQLLADVESRRSLDKQRRKAEQRLNASDKEKEFAARIAAGIFTEADIPDTVNRSTVLELADYYSAQLNANNEHLGRVKAEIRDMLDGKMEELFKNADNAKEPSAIGLNYGTPERNMLRIFGDEDGMKIYDYIFAPVAENEAERKKFSNRMHDEVRKIEGKNGKATELNNAESALVQMVIEGKAASEAVAGMETKRMIENAAHNLMNGQEKGDVAKMFGLTENEADLADRYARWLRAREMLESGEYDSVKIENAAKKYSEMYDKLYAAINDFLVAHGYDPIGFIKGYAPHMQPEENISMLNKVAESLGIGAAVNKLPTSIAGRTADFKPNKRWDPHFLQRLGNETEYNVVKGFQQYIDYVSDIFYHTDDVMRVRAASRWLRKTYSPENIRANIEWAEGLRSAPTETKASLLRDEGIIGKDTVLSESDTSRLMDQYIEQLFSQIDKTSKFGDLVTWMDNYANILAGKQSMADRSAESTFGRKTLNTGNKLVNGFAKAQVAGNVSSMLNQIAQIPQIFAELKGKYTRRALLDLTLKELFTGELKKSGWAEDSVYLTNKKGIDFLVTDKSEKIITAMFKPAEFMDGFVSTLAVRGKYLQEIGNGATHAEAMKAADTFGRQIMGDRTKGVKPTAFQSKNPVMQMLNIFQIEALNSWNHIIEDLPREIRQMAKTEGKDKAAKYLASIIIKALLAAFAVNRVAEEEYGGTPAPFDILGLTANFIASGEGLSTNTYIRTIIDNGWEKLTGERLFDTDPEKINEKFDWGSAIKETAANVSNDIPFLRNVSGMAGWGDKSLPMPNVVETGGDLLSSLFDEGGPFTPETAKNAVNFLAEVLPGGKQAKKTAFGIEALIRGGDYSGYGEKEKLKYTVGGDALEDIKAILFGKYSTTSSNDYYASGAKSLTEKQTKVWKELKASGADPDYLYDSIQKYRKIAADEDLSTYERGRQEREFVKKMKLSDKQKLEFYRGVTSADNRADKFEKMMSSGLNFNEVLAVYETYAEINEKDIKASEKATEFYRALDFMRFSDRQEATIKDCLKYYSQVPAEANRYEKFRATGMDAETAYQYTQALADIKIESGRTTATTAQKWRAVLDPSASVEEQMKALSVVMDEKQYAKLELAREFDIPPEAFVILEETLPDSSPTQAELEEYIEKMADYKTRSGGRVKLTNQQMAALWQIYGGYDSARNNPFDIMTGEKVITKNDK